jgi:hypothetical protein
MYFDIFRQRGEGLLGPVVLAPASGVKCDGEIVFGKGLRKVDIP